MTTAQDCHSEECNEEESHTTIAISTKQELDSSLLSVVQNDIIAILRCSTIHLPNRICHFDRREKSF